MVCVLAVLASVPLPRAAHAAFEGSDRGWEGTSEFVALAQERLGKARVVLANELDWAALRPADGLIILHPQRELDFVEASSFLRDGGRLALLDDYGKGTSLLERFRIRRVAAPRTPRRELRNNPAFALAFPSVQVVAGQEQGRHPIVAGVEQLVTNHPMGLEHPDLTPVLSIPATGEPEVMLAVTGIIADRGRLFAMGDPSAVINLMLRYPGNRAFAAGLVEYMVEDDTWGPRGGRLFILANGFSERRQKTGAASLVRDLDERLGTLQQRLLQAHEDGVPNTVALLFAIVTALGAIGWTVSAATRPYRQTTPRHVREPTLVAQGGSAGRVALLAAPTTHRALAMLELGNALEERLGLLLKVPPPISWSEILAEIDRQKALSQPSSERLRSLVEEIRRVESAVAASRPTRVTDRMVYRMRSSVETILREITEDRGGTP
ncbi:MAG: DUF4350 domain-containing protein [Polyangiaceae bacterium]|nr:DUF4350 domain-containing protein [Polyangiaceae bacterium]